MSGGGRVIADRALPRRDHRGAEAEFSHDHRAAHRFPYAFAVPAGVLREGEINMGCTEIMSPWGDAIAGQRSPRLLTFVSISRHYIVTPDVQHGRPPHC